ncbi:hypothetical protein SERLADRAFT_469067 [Serpula lacrymans var. lacrymans S7.9]|uniref:Uncharacterized protein n=1 Tax=Serpula lacrymans var. lacrymans (strain S7.9) TaxID=578457 RepID=F8NWK0_SERL9|nr:uncharacterized protein SERLADRAFT_469067 [Serpula lacrymans var. lacrymans S7.9]EGO25025.1 hypothetical protein SERLADRAFT_469067 [Serpula lacrymans var. lacrymans S7.9]
MFGRRDCVEEKGPHYKAIMRKGDRLNILRQHFNKPEQRICTTYGKVESQRT